MNIAMMHTTYLKILFPAALLVLVLQATCAQGDAEGNNGMVATAHPLASEAAIEMLKSGGNAVDAAVAAAFAIGVVEPDGSGIGGGGSMVIYLKDKKEAHYINYYPRSSENGSEAGYSGRKDARTAKAVCVPGTVAGLTLAHEKFGSLPLEQIMQPAIRYAAEGFPADAILSTLILDNIETVFSDEATTAVFCEDGFPVMEGDTIFQKELAETLRVVSREGRAGFYEGAVARSLMEGIKTRGGILTLEDFRCYEATLEEPLYGNYRGYDILTACAPQSGLCLIEALNILENADLPTGPHYSQSAETLHLIARAQRFTYADRSAYLGDPEKNPIPVTGLISKAYARERFEKIHLEEMDPLIPDEHAVGDPFPYLDEDKSGVLKKAGAPLEEPVGYDGHTTHLSVIDGDGNCVSLTQTLGTFFGSGQTVSGVLFNNAMTNFSYRTPGPNLYDNRKQPRSSIMPTIILKEGQPFLVAGSPGAARIISTVIQVVINVLDFGLDVSEANLAPRFYGRNGEQYLHLESGIRPDVRQKLEEMGYSLNLYEGTDLFFGGAQLIWISTENGRYYGSADPRRGGKAIGY